MRDRFLTGQQMHDQRFPDISWHGSTLYDPKWQDPDSRILGFTLAGLSDMEPDIHVMMNMSSESVFIELPLVSERQWFRVIDTADPSAYESQYSIESMSALNQLEVERKSVVVFEGRPLKT
jgi:glycogen operon protein